MFDYVFDTKNLERLSAAIQTDRPFARKQTENPCGLAE